MTAPADALEAAVPDLSSVALDQIAALGDTALAHSIALYRKRTESGTPAGKFNSCI